MRVLLEWMVAGRRTGCAEIDSRVTNPVGFVQDGRTAGLADLALAAAAATP
jgi:acyl-coenzyme A thioesterase PaaI-like protein